MGADASAIRIEGWRACLSLASGLGAVAVNDGSSMVLDLGVPVRVIR